MHRLFLLLFLVQSPALSVPVVPNFASGVTTSRTETKSKTVETIVSHDYNTGYTYSLSGTGLSADPNSLIPSATTVTGTTNGTSYVWTGLDLSSQSKPTMSLTVPGASFQLVESYSAPGLSNITTVVRETDQESITDTVSSFSR